MNEWIFFFFGFAMGVPIGCIIVTVLEYNKDRKLTHENIEKRFNKMVDDMKKNPYN